MLGDGAYINTGLIVPHRKRPGRALLAGEEADNAEHRCVRARVEHVLDDLVALRIRPASRSSSVRWTGMP